MNLAHVLSWGSSVSSLSSLKCSSCSSSSTRERDGEFCGNWQQRRRRELTGVCRGSSGDFRRTNGYSSSGRSSSSNAVSSRPSGSREQNNGNQNSSNRNSEGSRERYGRYSRAWDGNGKSGSRNPRDSEGRYGGGRSSSGGDAYRGRGDRRDRERKMHPGAYKMRDEQTGELVIVWGVEDDDDVPMPTAADLNWKKSTVALRGDTSEETWAKVIEQQSVSSGSYRVRGVEPEGKDWTDNLFEEDPEDDFEEDDFLHDENYSDSDSEELIDSRKVAVSRAPRVKVFGRDLWGKSQLKVKIPEDSKTDFISDLNLKQETVPSIDTLQAASVQKQDSLTGHKSSEYTRDILSPSGNIGEKNTSDHNRGHNIAQKLRSIDLQDEDSPAIGRTLNEDDLHLEGRVAARRDDTPAERSRASKVDKNSVETSTTVQIEDKLSERSSATRTNNESTLSKVAKVNDRSIEGRSKGSRHVVGGRNEVLKADDGVTEEREKTSSGSFNPYILDISEDDGNRSQFNQQKDVRKSDLLDRLRSQVLGVNRNDTEEASSPAAASMNEDIEGSDVSTEDPIRPPMRDLTARDNYDASIAGDFFSLKSFKDIGATPEVIEALSYLHVQKPSQIQAMAFKPILEGKSCIIAEQTGSGKTLAYGAPLVQRLKADEARTLGKSLSKKPRVLVLVPTGELAAQVLGNFRGLSKGGVPCRSIVITGGFKWKTQAESLEGGADVVVATPGRLLQQLEAGNIHFDNLISVVLDEVDILFDDEDFSKALQTINKAASIKVQYIHVTATLPVDIHDDLLERYPDCLSLMGPSLHRTAIGLQEVLVDCSGGEEDEKTPESAFANKRKALLQLVEERPVAKTIIFCNKVETCRKVENVLSRYDRGGKKITVLPYHAALSQETRLESMEMFIKSHPKERLFLVCTDRASRGIDSLDVEHVVLFDFPRDPSEYVRRVGRTARGAGGTGKVFAFVIGRQVGHARRIMARNDKGEPVHDVPGSRYYYRN